MGNQLSLSGACSAGLRGSQADCSQSQGVVQGLPVAYLLYSRWAPGAALVHHPVALLVAGQCRAPSKHSAGLSCFEGLYVMQHDSGVCVCRWVVAVTAQLHDRVAEHVPLPSSELCRATGAICARVRSILAATCVAAMRQQLSLSCCPVIITQHQQVSSLAGTVQSVREPCVGAWGFLYAPVMTTLVAASAVPAPTCRSLGG